MSGQEFHQMDKLIPYKNSTRGHPYVTDNDLQIHLDPTKDKISYENTLSFKSILSKYMGEKSEVQDVPTFDQLREREAIKKAMQDAETAYISMMQIRKDLEKAYKKLFE